MSTFQPLRVAILGSGRLPGLETLLQDPNRGQLYELSCVLSSEPELVESGRLDAHRIPVLIHPIRHFHRERNLPLCNLNARAEYDAELAGMLSPFEVDTVVLLGWNWILTAPMLSMFPERILALHDADLTLKDGDGGRRFVGRRAVHDALFAGEPETRSSVYLATRDIGKGPVLLMTGPYPVAPLAKDAYAWGAADMLDTYARAHRDWMIRDAWGRLAAKAIEHVAAGTIQILGDLAWIDGVPGPCRIGEAPAQCDAQKDQIQRGIPASCPFIQT
ncbi:MAG TPA: formyltransferase family protein [Thermoanaerobaculia bacterium]|nr:formyltransferase family protein [Thermoanaerobaculia bacterium]